MLDLRLAACRINQHRPPKMRRGFLQPDHQVCPVRSNRYSFENMLPTEFPRLTRNAKAKENLPLSCHPIVAFSVFFFFF